MTSGPTLALWVDGTGHPPSRLEAVLAAVLQWAPEGSEVVCLVDPDVTVSTEGVLVVASGDLDDAALLTALLADTRGDWLIWLDGSSILTPSAIGTILSAVTRFDIDLLYGDSTAEGGAPVRRPAFSPVRLRSQDYLGDLRGFRVAALRDIGGFGAGLRGAHPLDLALRLGSEPQRVLRIPEALSTSVAPRREMTEGHRLAVFSRLEALGVAAQIDRRGEDLRIRYPVVGTPLVSIVIPTRGTRARIRGRDSVLVVDAVRGILERSSYPALEIVIVADDATPQPVIDELVEIAGARLRLVRWSDEFNFSAKMNRGAVFARGEYLLLLNDDVDLLTPHWIETMLGIAQQPGIGLVGALLLFEDGTVQHGGHLYTDGWAGHIAFGWAADRDDRLGSMSVDREVSGVTAACALIRADVFWEVGGFSLDYAGNYNDVDLSLKVAATGRSNIWTPHARLFHFESKTRVADIAPSEIATLRTHWGTRLLSDPYWPTGQG